MAAEVRKRHHLILTCRQCGKDFETFPVNRTQAAQTCSETCRGSWISAQLARPVEVRFWEAVDKHGPVPADRPELGQCWVWTLKPNGHGYGRLIVSTKPSVSMGAHVVSYRLLVGEYPDGLELDHLCRNRICVRPTHLEPVTHKVNALRGQSPNADNARKSHCLRGHDFSDPSVLHVTKSGNRKCRVCGRDQQRTAYAARMEAVRG